MPEGHVLHRLAQDQQELVGHVVAASSPQGRFAEGADGIDGGRLAVAEAYGKHLRHRYDTGAELHVHLGMQGKWLRLDPPPPPRKQVRLRLNDSSVAWDLIAPTTCRLLEPGEWKTLVESLGPDPLRADADPAEVWGRLHSYRGALGAALLDQRVVAGVGNVLRAESLFLAGLNPARAASTVPRADFDRLWGILVLMMRRAVEDNRIITASDLADRKNLPEQQARMVYKQPQCRRCATPVTTTAIGGRTAYVCPVCQPY